MALVKKIHYCWFGSEEPETVRRNVENWRRMNPGYEIIRWGHDNSDATAYAFACRAMETRRWGFYADIVRLQKLLEHGGFYLDADVELVAPLDSLEPYGDKMLLGYMLDCALGTAVIYSPPGHPYLVDILEKYKHIRPDFWPVNNSIFTEHFINQVPGFLLDGRAWENSLCKLYPKEFFEQPAFIRSHGVSIHHACGSWNKAFSDFVFATHRNCFSHWLKWAKRQVRTWRSCRRNEFYSCYKQACKGVAIPFDSQKYYD